MEKYWKFLIENRSWNLIGKKIGNFRKSKFSIFDFRKISMKILIFSIFSFFRFSKNSNENFRFPKFSTKFSIFKIFDFRRNFFDQISKSIFDQKKSIFFHDLFFKPLKNRLENPHVKARSPENAMRTRVIIERCGQAAMSKNVH